MLEQHFQKSESGLKGLSTHGVTVAVQAAGKFQLLDKTFHTGDDVADVLLRNRVVGQLGQPMVTEFSVQLQLLTLLDVILGMFLTELVRIENGSLLISCAEVVPGLSILRVNLCCLSTVLYHSLILDRDLVVFICRELAMLGRLEQFKLQTTQLLVNY